MDPRCSSTALKSPPFSAPRPFNNHKTLTKSHTWTMDRVQVEWWGMGQGQVEFRDRDSHRQEEGQSTAQNLSLIRWSILWLRMWRKSEEEKERYGETESSTKYAICLWFVGNSNFSGH
ncbi:hypothetical protein Ddc_09503 [Ditylenchus destructor]|nr:hypothetical protein Ddc_09503 [Ditylenchus destructor]